jgi:hypothetical protein
MCNTGIRRTERLPCIQVDDHTPWPLFPTATIREFGMGHEPYRLIERVIKSVACSGELGKYHVFPRTKQSLYIPSTAIDGYIIIVYAVKEPNGFVADILIIDIRRIATSMEGDIGGELGIRWTIYALEAPHTGIEGDKASF